MGRVFGPARPADESLNRAEGPRPSRSDRGARRNCTESTAEPTAEPTGEGRSFAARNEERGEPLKRVGKKKVLTLTVEDLMEHFPKGVSPSGEGIDWAAVTSGLIEEVKEVKAEVAELRESLEQYVRAA